MPRSTTRDSDVIAPPKAFGPYQVHERLGVGGMATVHRAVQRGSDGKEREVALKRLLPHLAEDRGFVDAFVQEARLSAMLRHPHIAAMHELGKVGDTYFMAMEYVRGRDLRKCLRQARRASGPPPLDVVMTVAHQIADALDYAHNLRDDTGRALGLVHRDISPSNILVSETGDVKLIDFGIAKATAVSASRTGTIKGKLAYMAPEALAGEQDARSDLFSVGVVLHELLTARPLFADKDDFQVIRNLETMQPPVPSRFNTMCPREVDAFVLRTLEKAREQRWASGAAMRDAVGEICRELGIERSSDTVAGWIEWAFALPVPERPQPRYTDIDSSISDVSFITAPGEEVGDVLSLLDGDEVDPDDAVVIDLPVPLAPPPVPAARPAAPRPPPEPRTQRRATTGPLTPPSFGPPGPNPAELDLVTFRTPTQPPPIAANAAAPAPVPVPIPRLSQAPVPLPAPRPRTSSFVPVVADPLAPADPVARWKSLILIAIGVAIAVALGIAIASL